MAVAKSGFVKWLLVEHLPASLSDINSVYQCLKLLNRVTSATSVNFKDR